MAKITTTKTHASGIEKIIQYILAIMTLIFSDSHIFQNLYKRKNCN